MLDDSYKTVMVGQKNKVASQSSTIERKKLMVISMIIYIYSKPSSFIRTSAWILPGAEGTAGVPNLTLRDDDMLGAASDILNR